MKINDLADLSSIDRDFLKPEEVAQILHCRVQHLRVAAHCYPEQLGFPVCIIGRRVKIPKKPFISFMAGREEETQC